jgi:very-short-patch-repair endonuclease
MRYQWGPLLRDGGERRLNVAATRAKHRLTVVSSFSSHDVDPERLTKAGARLLAEYLEYACSGGTPVAAAGRRAGDAFEASVRSRLADYGITVVPQYGVGGYRVDFAAAHPDDPSRMILAVEADGASYRDSGSVRDRDRLRKEHLERLGWRFHRLWSTNWFHDPDAEVARLREAYEKAVAASPPPEPALPEEAAEPPDPSGPPAPVEPPKTAVALPPARHRSGTDGPLVSLWRHRWNIGAVGSAPAKARSGGGIHPAWPGNRLTSRKTSRQPSRNNPRNASATTTNATAVPCPATTRSTMPSPAAPSHAPRPAGDKATGRRQARVASHPPHSPARNGQAVDATPLSPRPSA